MDYYYNMRRTVIITILNISILCLLYPQDIRFKHLSSNDGLVSKSINAILQDSDGFMWFGTQDGLNKYDGHTFTIYRNNRLDSNSISGNDIRASPPISLKA